MMSNKHQTTNMIADAKLVDDIEPIDSGFISGENLLVSSEIIDDDITELGSPEEVAIKKGNSSSVPNEEEYMRLDSGVDLSESFSSLSIKNAGLNNLERKKQINTATTPVASKPDEYPWTVYFDQDEDGDTPLHIAIVQGLNDLALALIRIAPHPLLLDTANDDAQTPIHLAAATGQWRIVRWLIVAGAKPCPRNVRGDSPLHIAARNGDLMCCKAITDPIQDQERINLSLSYSQPPHQQLYLDQWNYEGQTCVHVAAIYGQVDVLRHLVCYGADINAREGRTGYTALHFAIEKRDEHLAHFLLNECKKLDVNIVTYGRKSCLQMGYPVSTTISTVLRTKGVVSYNSSDDEDDSIDEDSDSENELYENSKLFASNNVVINASA